MNMARAAATKQTDGFIPQNVGPDNYILHQRSTNEKPTISNDELKL